MIAEKTCSAILDDPSLETHVMENERSVARAVFDAYKLPDTLATFIGRFLHPNDGDDPEFADMLQNYSTNITHALGLETCNRTETLEEARARALHFATFARTAVWPETWTILRHRLSRWFGEFPTEHELREEWQHQHVNRLCWMTEQADNISHKVCEAAKLVTLDDDEALDTAAAVRIAREHALLSCAYSADAFIEAVRLGARFNPFILTNVVQNACVPTRSRR